MSELEIKTDGLVLAPQEAAALLGTLFDLPVEVRSESRKGALDRGALAVYGSSGGVARLAFHFDPTLAAGAGAALTRIPAAAADEASRRSRLPDNVLENLCEVTNVLGRWPRSRWGQLRLQTTALLPATLPAPVGQALKKPRPLATLLVTIAGYRPGLLTVLAIESPAGEGGDDR
jgi:hypothetical protein